MNPNFLWLALGFESSSIATCPKHTKNVAHCGKVSVIGVALKSVVNITYCIYRRITHLMFASCVFYRVYLRQFFDVLP